MLNYLEKGSTSDSANQSARFVSDPKVELGKAIRWLVKYLLGTRDKDMVYHPDLSRGLEVYVDADFAGNWNQDEAVLDRDTTRSRHGYIILTPVVQSCGRHNCKPSSLYQQLSPHTLGFYMRFTRQFLSLNYYKRCIPMASQHRRRRRWWRNQHAPN